MKPRKTWLHTAVRAYEAQKLTHQQGTARAREALEEASEHQEHASHALSSLSAAWVKQRSTARLDPDLDSAYQRFHGHLEQRATSTAQAQQQAQNAFDAATAQLKTSHSTHHMLKRVTERAASRHAHEARGREHQAMAEAWLLGQLAKDERT
ncbi:hypothetical protein ACS5PN_27985 [Roseateles sp. NT4]|uniref:hypothetical protein n=1 Tax=Roseateles sp. NT4 TaxID=3453715 RepID=UPI003EEEA3A6